MEHIRIRNHNSMDHSSSNKDHSNGYGMQYDDTSCHNTMDHSRKDHSGSAMMYDTMKSDTMGPCRCRSAILNPRALHRGTGHQTVPNMLCRSCGNGIDGVCWHSRQQHRYNH